MSHWLNFEQDGKPKGVDLDEIVGYSPSQLAGGDGHYVLTFRGGGTVLCCVESASVIIPALIQRIKARERHQEAETTEAAG